MVERLPDRQIESIFQTRDRALWAGLDLIAWASGPRGRIAVDALSYLVELT
jgi:hypothetical protein